MVQAPGLILVKDVTPQVMWTNYMLHSQSLVAKDMSSEMSYFANVSLLCCAAAGQKHTVLPVGTHVGATLKSSAWETLSEEDFDEGQDIDTYYIQKTYQEEGQHIEPPQPIHTQTC